MEQRSAEIQEESVETPQIPSSEDALGPKKVVCEEPAHCEGAPTTNEDDLKCTIAKTDVVDDSSDFKTDDSYVANNNIENGEADRSVTYDRETNATCEPPTEASPPKIEEKIGKTVIPVNAEKETTESEAIVPDEHAELRKSLEEVLGSDDTAGNDAPEIALSRISSCDNIPLLPEKTEAVFNKSELLAILEGEDDNKPTEKKKKASKPKTQEPKLNSEDKVDSYGLLENKPIVIRSYGRKSSNAVVTDLVADWSEVEILEDELLEEERQKQKDAEKAANNQIKPPKKEEKKESKKKRVEKESKKSDSTDPKRNGAESAVKSLKRHTETASPDVGGTGRVSRVIKKKVIWDPDNPETFKFASEALRKSQSGPAPDTVAPVQEPPSAKPESDSKPPDVKKKKETVKKQPTGVINKIKKQNFAKKIKATMGLKKDRMIKKKKMTEIDRLLMDEGAVNMIYQLENSGKGEATEGESALDGSAKAEMIKKAVISQSAEAQDSPAKTFRKREIPKPKPKEQPAPLKRTPGRPAKSRDSIKSPSLFDEYATRNAESSIIIRRHSSSSYSSSCLSPRRLSDIDTAQNNHADEASFLSPKPKRGRRRKSGTGEESVKEDPLATDSILPAKKGLKSTVAQVFSLKRKKSMQKQAAKMKRLTPFKSAKTEDSTDLLLPVLQAPYSQLSIEYEGKFTRITIDPTESTSCLYNLQVLLELRRAVSTVSDEEKSSVTLITSRDGRLCGGLDPRSLYTLKQERKFRVLQQVSQAWCDLVLAMIDHSKVLACGVEGACAGIGTALLPLMDFCVASERSTFTLPGCNALLQPGLAILNLHPHSPHPNVVAMSALTGRPLTATEALDRGLISRALWPHQFREELDTLIISVAKGIQSSVLLTKRLLNVGDVKEKLWPALQAEKKLLLDYWGSADGQTVIKAAVEAIEPSPHK